jgi:hypothetical protein
MKQKLMAVASAAVIGLTAVAIPNKAEANWRGGWWVPGAVIGGIAPWSSYRFKALLLRSGLLRLRVRTLLLRWRSLLLRLSSLLRPTLWVAQRI